ncbi:MAG: hypothetical protein ACM336_17230 [Acidobacteriota bacterium]
MPNIGRPLAIAGVLCAAAAIALLPAPSEQPLPPAAPKPPRARLFPTRRIIPPPMFSREYVDALEGVIEMEPEDARALERQVQMEPEAWTKRLRLLAYYRRGDQEGRPESYAARRRHVLWLIEHQPQSEILSSPFGRLDQESEATRLWERALEGSRNTRVFWNAAQYFAASDAEANLRCLRKAVELDPGNVHYGQALGTLYGQQAAGTGPTAAAALRELETTTNAAVLEAGIRVLHSVYNKSLFLGPSNPARHDTAQRLFMRLEALDPDVDRAWVLPQPPRASAAPAKSFEELRKTVRRLRVEDFPELPASVAVVLRARQCAIPQPLKDGPNLNVIRGEFFAKGQQGWAALCSSGGKSRILVFRDGHDEHPEELSESDDDFYLIDSGQGWTSYMRQIVAVDRKFIVGHYRAYGGPKPPPIDHQGLDDSFLEKASVTWYRHEGKWMQLQGAD